jgi:hypothetical protein
VSVLITIVLCEEDGALLACDTIEHENKLWLVPEWIEGPIPGTESPSRIICLEGLALVKPDARYQADWALQQPMSRAVLAGQKIMQGVVVIEKPDVVRNVD